MTSFGNRRPTGDEGVSLVIVLVFMTVVSLLVMVGLSKAASTSQTGSALVSSTGSRYALDAGLERAVEVLRADNAVSAPAVPAVCTGPGSVTDITSRRDGSGLQLTSGRGSSTTTRTVHYTCQTKGGSARNGSSNQTNFAIVITGRTPGSLTTYGSSSGSLSGANCSGPGTTSYLQVFGGVFLSAPQANSDFSGGLPLLICNGDLVETTDSASPTCSSSALSDLLYPGNPSGQVRIGSPGQLADCTDETPDEATGGAPSLGSAPADDVSNCEANFNGLVPGSSSCSTGHGGGGGSVSCRVFYPGRYSAVPDLLTGSGDANYFASGDYYFQFAGGDTLSIGSSTTVIAGAPNTSASTPDSGQQLSGTGCAGMTDVLAAANQPPSIPATYVPAAGATGVQWVFGGANSKLEVDGTLTLNSQDWSGDLPPATLVAASSSGNGYSAWSGTGSLGGSGATCSGGYFFCNKSGSDVVINGKLFADTAPVKLWGANPSTAAVTGGTVVQTLRLGANVSGTGALALSSPGGTPPAIPPYRVIKITSSVDDSGLTGSAVATFSNFPPYDVAVKTWRISQ